MGRAPVWRRIVTGPEDDADMESDMTKFINAFPAQRWVYVLVDRNDKRKAVREELYREDLLKKLPELARMASERQRHFFVRPILSNWVFLDADNVTPNT